MSLKLNKTDSLIIVDVQKDFCPGGALPVPDGDKVVPVLNGYIDLFLNNGLPIFATRDWHPENHCSFKEYGGTWPRHCIKNTEGAKFHPNLNLPESACIISKAVLPEIEAYSGFQGTNLKKILYEVGSKRLFIGGLATDYCVKETVLDAVKSGFTTFLLEDASMGVDVRKGDSERAIDEMLLAGAICIKIKDIF